MKNLIQRLLQALVIFSLIFSVIQGEIISNKQIQANTLVNLSHSQYLQAELKNVVDGDTINVYLDGQETSVRLIGIDTPETKKPNTEIECYGPEASQALKEKLSNYKIILELDKSQGFYDKYNRVLAYVFSHEQNINEWMIQQGYAREYTYDKPYKYQNFFQQAEQKAKNSKLGLWGNCEN